MLLRLLPLILASLVVLSVARFVRRERRAAVDREHRAWASLRAWFEPIADRPEEVGAGARVALRGTVRAAAGPVEPDRHVVAESHFHGTAVRASGEPELVRSVSREPLALQIDGDSPRVPIEGELCVVLGSEHTWGTAEKRSVRDGDRVLVLGRLRRGDAAAAGYREASPTWVLEREQGMRRVWIAFEGEPRAEVPGIGQLVLVRLVLGLLSWRFWALIFVLVAAAVAAEPLVKGELRDRCARSAECASEGACGVRLEGVRYVCAATNEGCRASTACTRDARCALDWATGACAPLDCTGDLCGDRGQCTLADDRKQCIAKSDDDCLRSTLCGAAGYCALHREGTCVRCVDSVACEAEGRCVPGSVRCAIGTPGCPLGSRRGCFREDEIAK